MFPFVAFVKQNKDGLSFNSLNMHAWKISKWTRPGEITFILYYICIYTTLSINLIVVCQGLVMSTFGHLSTIACAHIYIYIYTCMASIYTFVDKLVACGTMLEINNMHKLRLM